MCLCRYPELIDSAIQSKGAALVGTTNSAITLISKRRVWDWNHGPGHLVSISYFAML